METIVVGTHGSSGDLHQAGSIWVRLQYMLGLQKLGHEVFWLDRLGQIDPLTAPHSVEYLTDRFGRLAEDFGFRDRYCIEYAGGGAYFGLTKAEYFELVTTAEALLNIGGYLPPDSDLMRIPRRVYIDVDPGFTQIWSQRWDMGFGRHNFFCTVGQNVDGEDFAAPRDGIDWQPTLPPVFLDAWPASIDENCQRFSTVANWRGKALEWNGQRYGRKRDEFLRFIELPTLSQEQFEIALSRGPTSSRDIELLLEHGWVIHDPYLYVGDPFSYREFIQLSRAEFGIAKHGYVQSRSGWVSDRTACYLASGKPALVQSTGFEARLPTGQGLLTFQTIEEALAGIEAINRDYLAHCQAARRLAEEYFSAEIVLRRLLEEIGI